MNTKRGPWTITGTKVVYQNPWILVREDKVIRPDGKNGIFGTITQPGGSSVIPMDEKGNVYLTEEYRYAIKQKSIEAISGGSDKKESRLKTAKRELKEETGFSARKWTYLGFINPLTSVLSSPNHMYLAQRLSVGKKSLEGTEKIVLHKMPFKKAMQMIDSGKISHAATIVALLKIRELIKR